MAIRSDELYQSDAAVLAFPTAFARGRAERQRRATFARRRVAAASLLAVTLFTSVQVASHVAGASPQVASVPGAPASVRVRPGMTVWDVAERYAMPGSDPRAYVETLWDLNDLEGAPRVGTRLSLPQ